MANTRKRTTKRTKEGAVPPPDTVREWDRGTRLISLFVATGSGYIIGSSHDDKGRVKPASLLFVSQPGQGKTELLDRFRPNPNLAYKTDLTSRGFYRVLREAREGITTHIVATEFQKFFQRKLAVAENLLGVMVQAMEEGVGPVDIGNKQYDYGGVRVGLLGAVTHGTLDRKREFLAEMGFLSRAAVIPWALPIAEKKAIMHHIAAGNTQDIIPVSIELPDEPVAVDFPESVAQDLITYVWRSWRESALRVFGRMRSLCMAAALLEGRDIVEAKDIEHVLDFDDYWQNMVIGE